MKTQCLYDCPHTSQRRTPVQVRANHVFLLEPALEPAIEQQAVARVHRMGQLR